jgi:DNA-binding protein H-NS
MARTANLTNMDVAQLLELRKRIDATLVQRRGELEKQLRDLGGFDDGARVGRGRRGVSALKGRKVAAKYRDPVTGATWSGRGAKAAWIVAAMKEGKTLEDFLIEELDGGTRKKRRAKR